MLWRWPSASKNARDWAPRIVRPSVTQILFAYLTDNVGMADQVRDQREGRNESDEEG